MALLKAGVFEQVQRKVSLRRLPVNSSGPPPTAWATPIHVEPFMWSCIHTAALTPQRRLKEEDERAARTIPSKRLLHSEYTLGSYMVMSDAGVYLDK